MIVRKFIVGTEFFEDIKEKQIKNLDLSNVYVDDTVGYRNTFNDNPYIESVTNFYMTNSCYSPFNNCQNLHTIEITGPIVNIEGLAEGCYSLENISLPDTLYSLGDIGSVINPNIHYPSKIKIMDKTFQGCTQMVSAPIIPNSVTSINTIFGHCYLLENAPEIPNSVLFMDNSFHYCTSLEDAPTIPNSVISMGNTFNSCSLLTGDILIKSNRVVYAQNCFNNTSLIKNVYIPFKYDNGVNTSTYNAFVNAGYGIDPLDRVNGVCLYDYIIDFNEWDYTENGDDILVTNYKGTNPNVILPNSLRKNVVFTNSIFNNTKTLIQNVDLNNCKFENDSIFQLFINASNLDTVSNPNENIIDGFSAFENCSKLVNAPVFSNALIYGARMFDNCRLLEEYTIPNNIQDLDTCFQHCYNLKTVNDLPSSVEKLNWGFVGCSKLTKCPDMSSCSKLNGMFKAFGDCYGMTGSINLPSITGYADSIDLNMSEAFSHCNNATSCPNIPDTAVNLYRVFDTCDKLEGRINVYSTKVANASSLFGDFPLSKNREIYIPFYEEGTTVYTQTYNSFTGAGYSETTRKNGVLLHDLNAE